jgi:hypothetical protein
MNYSFLQTILTAIFRSQYEHLYILTILPEPRPVSALCWQIHRPLAVLVPSSHLWIHCPRASNGLLPRRSYLVGYAQ